MEGRSECTGSEIEGHSRHPLAPSPSLRGAEVGRGRVLVVNFPERPQERR
jgi:hypothetical protein